MNDIDMPKGLHEVFGKKQSLVEMICTLVFASIGSLIIYNFYYQASSEQPIWKTMLGFILIADVLAGCLANFSRGTNQFYAERAKARLIFIAIHIHIIAIAWLLNASLVYAYIIWIYTIGSALVVNTLIGHRHQLFIAASLMCCGLLLLMFLALPIWFLISSLFFMIKVLFSFAVDHYGNHYNAKLVKTI